MAYTHTTLADCRTQLSRRLHDTGFSFWRDTGTYIEVDLYIFEALRTWQVLTAYWRARGTISTSASTPFYSIPSTLSGSLRSYTLTDRDLVAIIQAHLLEPITGSTWTGTEQFTLADITDALNRRRNYFIAETGCRLVNLTQAAASPPISRQSLTDTIIDVRHLWWVTPEGYYSRMSREDELSLNAYSSTWTTSYATPYSYSITASPPLTLQVAPAPSNSGSLDMLAVQLPAALDPSTGVLLNIPDDFAWIVKWGVLADLLSKDGPARDPLRAEYCLRRYNQGVELAKLSSCIIQSEISGIPLITSSLAELDLYDYNWRNPTSIPGIICPAGIDLLALYPVPNGVYGLTLDVVRNTPLPTVSGDQIQLGREELEAVLAYAEHLACFKEGGTEFTTTIPYWEQLFQMASGYNDRLGAASLYSAALAEQSRRDKRFRAYKKKGESLGALADA